MGIGSSILGLILLIVVIWAIIQTVQSPATPGVKLLWTVLLIILPVLGLILWAFLGPRAKK